MTIKSPCVNKCNLNTKNNLCDGCYRTSDEISNWTKYSIRKKQSIIKILKLRKLKVLCFLICLVFNSSYSNDIWIGKWTALDKWQSEFLIEIHKNGNAQTNYGNGESGAWSIVDGNLQIIWESGKKDYLFRGVMGFQRLSKNKGDSYTSGMKKLLD